jgi:hypothetical protein
MYVLAIAGEYWFCSLKWLLVSSAHNYQTS